MPGGSQNTQPAQGGITGFLAKAPDPLGISNGGGGLDPLNLMGSMPEDPNARGPLTLPSMNIAPQFYDPNSFVKRHGGGGMYNNMAAQLAGPMYDPRLLPMAKKGTGTQGPVRGMLDAGGNGGYGYGAGVGGGYPGLAALLQGLGSNNTMPVRGVR